MSQELTLDSVADAVCKCAEKFERDYGLRPLDVFVGPDEFMAILRTANFEVVAPDWHYTVGVDFLRGMRVRLMPSPGILVGILSNNTTVLNTDP